MRQKHPLSPHELLRRAGYSRVDQHDEILHDILRGQKYHQSPGLFEQFQPRTWRDDVREFIFDLRSNPRLALICTFAGLALGFAASFGVAEIIIWVQS